MAEQLLSRQRLARDATAVSPSTRASLNNEIRLVADISTADLQNPLQRWRLEAWRSADDGATWQFLCGQTDEGRTGRTEASWLAHTGGDLSGQLIRLRVTSLARPLDLGGSVDVSATAVRQPLIGDDGVRR